MSNNQPLAPAPDGTIRLYATRETVIEVVWINARGGIETIRRHRRPDLDAPDGRDFQHVLDDINAFADADPPLSVGSAHLRAWAKRLEACGLSTATNPSTPRDLSGEELIGRLRSLARVWRDWIDDSDIPDGTIVGRECADQLEQVLNAALGIGNSPEIGAKRS